MGSPEIEATQACLAQLELTAQQGPQGPEVLKDKLVYQGLLELLVFQVPLV